MYIITRSHFLDFVNTYGYDNLQENESFEKFVIYCIASKYICNQTITKDLIDSINIGNGGDWGIDGLLIVINGRIITTTQDVDDMLKANGYLEVQFVFIQAKDVESLNIGDLGKALDGVEYIFKEIAGENKLPSCNPELKTYRSIIDHIYSYNAKFKDGTDASCDFYYVYTGKYKTQDDFTARLNKTKIEIANLKLTSPFTHYILDRDTIVDYYKGTKARNEVTIQVEQQLDMPFVENIQESYLCLLPFKELIKLYINTDDKVIQSVFYDNVRDFQGYNPVNNAMSQSVKNGELNLFTAMNNGITVVAKNFNRVGNKFKLNDYQIVNGCQTCNILYQNRFVKGLDDMLLVVKIIASKDKETIDRIIIGNNSQTEVKREQLVSLLHVQHTIEDYYNAQKDFERLYYERRSKQYRNTDVSVPQYKIITIAAQTKSFISMMMEEPHNVRGYYGCIMNQYDDKGKTIYSENTHPAFYYTCALADFKLGEMFSHRMIDKKYKKIKYHLLYAFRLMCEKWTLKSFSSNKSQEYCDHLCKKLCDWEKCKEAFCAATQLIDYVLKRDPNDQDGNRVELTNELKKTVHAVRAINERKKISQQSI